MSLPGSLRARLLGQLEALNGILAQTPADALTRRSPSGKWSVHENVAHLARHHDVFLERLEQMLAQDRPELPRYRAEDDPEWPRWAGLTTDEAVRRLKASRARLIERLDGLDDTHLSRTGVHPLLGEMAIPVWLEFVALHEAHHLYVAMRRARGAE